LGECTTEGRRDVENQRKGVRTRREEKLTKKKKVRGGEDSSLRSKKEGEV